MEHAIASMKKILENGQAEPAHHLDSHAECWYLPLFAVYPKKPGSVRCVFDSFMKGLASMMYYEKDQILLTLC